MNHTHKRNVRVHSVRNPQTITHEATEERMKSEEEEQYDRVEKYFQQAIKAKT